MMNALRPLLFACILVSILVTGCHDSTGPAVAPGFLGGTGANHEIGVVVNSTGKALTLFQLGSPATQEQIALGTSNSVTPVGLSVRGRVAAVPLGDAGSVALIDLEGASITRFFTFASGNTTGSAFYDDTTIFAAGSTLGIVGRMTTGQTSGAITATVPVAPAPSAIVVAGNRIIVISSNYDNSFTTLGNGIATAIDPKTMQVLGTATMGATQLGQMLPSEPDGLVYVVNSGDYPYNVSPGNLTILDPSTMQVVATVSNMGTGPGAISIDANGLAYISSDGCGTVIWNTNTRTFVRGATTPSVCAKIGTVCRGAFAATTNAAGDLYQLFFGDGTHSSYAFVYKGSGYTLSDSVAVGVGPAAIVIRTF